MPKSHRTSTAPATDHAVVDRKLLVEYLNEDLAREYQAIIAYVVYSQVLKGAQYMAIAKEIEVHAGEELQHALTIAKQIDYLGGTPTVVPKAVKMSDDRSCHRTRRGSAEYDGVIALHVPGDEAGGTYCLRNLYS